MEDPHVRSRFVQEKMDSSIIALLLLKVNAKSNLCSYYFCK